MAQGWEPQEPGEGFQRRGDGQAAGAPVFLRSGHRALPFSSGCSHKGGVQAPLSQPRAAGSAGGGVTVAGVGPAAPRTSARG